MSVIVDRIEMVHPFEKLLYSELRKSTLEKNLVLKKAEEIRKKGYRPEEIHRVLTHLHGSLVSDADRELVGEALEAIESYLSDA